MECLSNTRVEGWMSENMGCLEKTSENVQYMIRISSVDEGTIDDYKDGESFRGNPRNFQFRGSVR